MVTLTDTRDFATRVYTDVSEKHVTFMAAGIAYNAFVSLAPLLLVVFVALSLIGGGLEARVVAAAGEWLPGPIAGIVEALFADEGSVGGASVIGFVVLVWGALKVFRGLKTAFSEIYETSETDSFPDQIRDAVVVLCALVLAVAATVGVTAVFAAFSDVVPFLGLMTPLVLVGGLCLAFLPLYYVFPGVDVRLRDVVPGAAFAAVGWAAFQGLFQVYLTVSDPGSGSFFGGIIVLVTYLYFSSLVLLIGAVVNSVRGDHAAGRPGGVGTAAVDGEIRREATLDRDELDAYLRGLNERLTARYDAPTVPGDGPPRPRDSVRLVESVGKAEDGRRWEVRLAWTPEADSGGASESETMGPTGEY